LSRYIEEDITAYAYRRPGRSAARSAIARGAEITVSAAVSLKEALTDVAAAYEKQGGDT
jgi:ABC-type molybdate transport system substrate-binding protein